MIVLDTHAWIWWVSEPSLLSDRAATAISQSKTVGICPISCWELSTKVANGKLTLDREVTVWVKQALTRARVNLVPFSAEVAVRAGQLGKMGFHGDPADRIITATALEHRAPLVTKDRRISEFSLVQTIW